MDDELQKLTREIKGIDLSGVVSLKKHYESDTVEKFTNKLKSIESLKSIETPLILKDNKYFLDLKSRYFTEDFIYGLAIIKSFGILFNVEMPTIDEVLKWYSDLLESSFFDGEKFVKDFEVFPHNNFTKEKLIDIYSTDRKIK